MLLEHPLSGVPSYLTYDCFWETKLNWNAYTCSLALQGVWILKLQWTRFRRWRSAHSSYDLGLCDITPLSTAFSLASHDRMGLLRSGCRCIITSDTTAGISIYRQHRRSLLNKLHIHYFLNIGLKWNSNPFNDTCCWFTIWHVIQTRVQSNTTKEKNSRENRQ